MRISVILCTYNRCDSLAIALNSVATSQFRRPVDWEVLIVDNNSKDNTRAVAEEFCRRYPNAFRYIFEQKQGKSNALNRGICESTAELLAFMDDDVIVEPDWLENLTAPLEDATLAGVGGRIVSPLDFSPPEWLAMSGPYDMSGILALFDKGANAKELTDPPFGTNMAFRRQVFEEFGLFRTDLGPCPGSEIRGEDTEFGQRVLRRGVRLWYQPTAIVHHAVLENRLEKSYFLRFLYDHGRASIRQKDNPSPIGFIPRLYFTLFKIAFTMLPGRAIAWIVSADSKRRFQRKCMVWMNLGQISEIRARLRNGNAAVLLRKSASSKENDA
jgi:GT2 family glycosyltransferase